MSLLSLIGLGPAPQRTALRGGGSVAIPHPYAVFGPGHYRYRDRAFAMAYRRYHSTLAGTNECDGAIAIARPSQFATLQELVRDGRATLTTRWAHANESEGRWYGNPETFGEIAGEGPNGPELIGKLSVHMVSMLKVYDAPGCLYAVNDRRGVMIVVWIWKRHGGEKRARRYADAIAASFQP